MDLLREELGLLWIFKIHIVMETITVFSDLLFSQLGFSSLRQRKWGSWTKLFPQVLASSNFMGCFTKYPVVPLSVRLHANMTLHIFLKTKKFKFQKLGKSAGPSFSFLSSLLFVIIFPDNRDTENSTILYFAVSFKTQIKKGDQREQWRSAGTPLWKFRWHHLQTVVWVCRGIDWSPKWMLGFEADVGLTLQCTRTLGCRMLGLSIIYRYIPLCKTMEIEGGKNTP